MLGKSTILEYGNRPTSFTFAFRKKSLLNPSSSDIDNAFQSGCDYVCLRSRSASITAFVHDDSVDVASKPDRNGMFALATDLHTTQQLFAEWLDGQRQTHPESDGWIFIADNSPAWRKKLDSLLETFGL